MNPIKCVGALLTCILVGVALGHSMKHEPTIKWVTKYKGAVRYDDKYCYIFKLTFHDVPVEQLICREYFAHERSVK